MHWATQLMLVGLVAVQTAFVGMIWLEGLPVRDDRSSIDRILDEHDELMSRR